MLLHPTPESQQYQTEPPILQAQGLAKYYGNRDHGLWALDHIDLEVYPGEFLGIMGPSGSGKTTLLNLIATIDRATEGSIQIGDTNLVDLSKREAATFRNERLGFIFQDYNLIETLTAYENIILPLTLSGRSPDEAQAWIHEITHLLGMGDLLNRFPDQLSGGEAQRIAACRAVIMQPDLVLADEPTGALDSASSRQLLNLLSKLRETQGTTLLLVSHDAFAASYCSRILFLRDGAIYHELLRGETDRDTFYHRILDVLRTLGGEAHATKHKPL